MKTSNPNLKDQSSNADHYRGQVERVVIQHLHNILLIIGIYALMLILCGVNLIDFIISGFYKDDLGKWHSKYYDGECEYCINAWRLMNIGKLEKYECNWCGVKYYNKLPNAV